MSRTAMVLMLTAALASGPGCATVVNGTSQTVTIRTRPPGGLIYYQGRPVRDGEQLLIQKTFEPTRINIGTAERPVFQDLRYDPDPLLIADGVLLLFFVVPGLAALGIDFGTGSWRNFHFDQYVYVQTVGRPVSMAQQSENTASPLPPSSGP